MLMDNILSRQCLLLAIAIIAWKVPDHFKNLFTSKDAYPMIAISGYWQLLFLFCPILKNIHLFLFWGLSVVFI